MQKMFSSWKKKPQVGQPLPLWSPTVNCETREESTSAVTLALATSTVPEAALNPKQQ